MYKANLKVLTMGISTGLILSASPRLAQAQDEPEAAQSDVRADTAPAGPVDSSAATPAASPEPATEAEAPVQSQPWVGREKGPDAVDPTAGAKSADGEHAVTTSVPTSEPPTPDAPAVAEETAASDWTRNLTLGGGAILYFYQPTEGGDNNLSLFFANLILDAKWGDWGLHVEPRFRDTKLRPFFEGPVWVQEAYGSYTLDSITLKVGKTYKRTGLFWDNSFYGNVQVYDGLKLDPNYGLSLEGSFGQKFGLDFAAQYFVVDGKTNVSLQNRDTISIPGARRRNTVVGRVEPFINFNEQSSLRVGLSAEHFEADLPEGADGVTRLAADAKYTHSFGDLGAIGVWGEFLHQNGAHTNAHPFPGDPTATPPVSGQGSADNNYVLAGAEYSFWKLTARYNVSYVNYGDVNVSEILHVPGLGINANEHLNLLGEFVVWRQDTPTGEVPYDTSVNITLHGRF